MRVLNRLLSLGLILYTVPLQAAENLNEHILDDAAHEALSITIENPNDSVLGMSIKQDQITRQRLVTANRNPVDGVNHYESNGFSCVVRMAAEASSLSGSGVYNSVATTVSIASRNACQTIALQVYTQKVTHTRSYPFNTEFIIADQLRDRLSNVDTGDLVNFKTSVDAINTNVVDSVMFGYLSMLEINMTFQSTEDVAAFSGVLADNPGAFEFLTGPGESAEDDQDVEELSNRRVRQQNELNQLAANIQRKNIRIEMFGRIVQRGTLVDATPTPAILANFGSAFGDISSFSRIADAYNTWLTSNMGKSIENSAVIKVRSKPISSYPCYEDPIPGFLYDEQALSLQTANTLLQRKIRARTGIMRNFLSIITRAQRRNKEQDLLALIDREGDLFQSLINESQPIDAKGNHLIHWASYFDLPRLIEHFVDMGANIDQQNNDGITPLMIVSRNGYINTFNTIMNYNPDFEIQDNNNYTALTHASATSNSGIAQISFGAACVFAAPAVATACAGTAYAGATAAAAATAETVGFFTIPGSIILRANFPDYSCHHTFFCNHTRIRDILIDQGANQDFLCNRIGSSIKGCANLITSLEKGVVHVGRSVWNRDREREF